MEVKLWDRDQRSKVIESSLVTYRLVLSQKSNDF